MEEEMTKRNLERKLLYSLYIFLILYDGTFLHMFYKYEDIVDIFDDMKEDMGDDEIVWNDCPEYHKLLNFGFDSFWVKSSLTLYNKNFEDCLEYLLSSEHQNTKDSYDAIIANDPNAFVNNDVWKCELCAFKNRGVQLMCLFCSLGRRPPPCVANLDEDVLPAIVDIDLGWECPLCTFENGDSKLAFCDMCQKGKNSLCWEKLWSGESRIVCIHLCMCEIMSLTCFFTKNIRSRNVILYQQMIKMVLFFGLELFVVKKNGEIPVC